MTERIVGVPTAILRHVTFEKGVCISSNVETRISKNVELRDRTPALEVDETFQQLVVYVTVSNPEKDVWVYYDRQKMNESEDRLKASLSLGFGGHVNEDDFKYLDQHGLDSVLEIAAARELSEEIPKLSALKGSKEGRVVRWLRDTSNPVGRVHIGVHIHCTVPTDSIKDLGFNVLTAESLNLLYERFESWSQILLKTERIVHV